MRPFCYTMGSRHRRFALGGCAYFTIESRTSRLRARGAYRDLRTAGIGTAQARLIVTELLATGQCAIAVDPLTPSMTLYTGTHVPKLWHKRPEVAA